MLARVQEAKRQGKPLPQNIDDMERTVGGMLNAAVSATRAVQPRLYCCHLLSGREPLRSKCSVTTSNIQVHGATSSNNRPPSGRKWFSRMAERRIVSHPAAVCAGPDALIIWRAVGCAIGCSASFMCAVRMQLLFAAALCSEPLECCCAEHIVPMHAVSAKGLPCPLAGRPASRNTKCPLTRKAYKACCGRQALQ